MADMSTKIDSFSAKLDLNNAELASLREELTSNVTTINTRIDNIQEDSDSKLTPTYVEALKFSPTKQAVSQPQQSSHIADHIAQSITNCTYPNTPVLSHHPTHVVSWFRQSILRKTKLATSSPTFHYDAMRKFSPEVFLTLRDMARMQFNILDFRFPADDDAFYAAILTTIFWDKNYDNLLSLFQSAVPPTSDQFSNHVYVCGVRSIITILPEHLNQYDINHIISAVRKFLTPPLQLLFDGYCTTITSLDHIVPALLRSLAASHANQTRSSNSFTQPYPSLPPDRSDRTYLSGSRDHRDNRSFHSPSHDQPRSDLKTDSASRPSTDNKPHTRLNFVRLHIPDMSEYSVPICENCDARNDHDTENCPHPCQMPECDNPLVRPHAHCKCPYFNGPDDF
jgi:hypothetical protein